MYAARNIAVLAAIAALTYSPELKEPCRTSPLSGREYVQELLGTAHETRVNDVLRVSPYVARELIEKLAPFIEESDNMDAQEVTCMMLYTLGQGVAVRNVAERFQHSTETVSRRFREGIDATLAALGEEYMIQPDESYMVPSWVRENPEFWPYFRIVLGAVDGTLVPCKVKPEAADRYRCRKGFTAQNVLGACDWEAYSTYCLPGGEGCGADSTVLNCALEQPPPQNLRVPTGKVYLGDQGYPNTNEILAPYRGVRYHLKEYGTGAMAPQNAKELFNLRHAKARVVIERFYGMLKNRFQILQKATNYCPKMLSKIILVCFLLMNFIKKHNAEEHGHYSDEEQHNLPTRGRGNQNQQEDEAEADARRDQIAAAMWVDYTSRAQGAW